MKNNLTLKLVFILQAAFFCFPLFSQQTNVNQKSKNNNFLEEWSAEIGKAVSIKKYNEQEALADTLQPVLRSGVLKIFDRPDEDYINKTTRLDVSSIENKVLVYSVSEDNFTVTFDAPMKKYDPGFWEEWGFLPEVENENPHFLWGFYTNLELNFSKPVCVFGLEIAASYYGTFPISLELYNHSTLIGTIDRKVVDLASLFAVEVPWEIPVTRAIIKAPWGAYGIGIANIRFSDRCRMSPSGISAQPVSVSVCEGGSHTFSVGAEGENLTYQWYKGNNKIFGANKNTLTITNVSYTDYDQYYVSVYDGTSTFFSNRVTLWVADPLPQTLRFSEFPDVVSKNGSYKVTLAGYPDVSNYTWSYSGTFSKFEKLNTTSNENILKTTGDAFGGGVVTVELKHVCGNRLVARTAGYQSPTGKEDVKADLLRIYPNPTVDVVTVTGCSSEVKLYNISGVLLGTYPAGNGKLEIDLSRFSKGTYLIDCGGNTYKVMKK